MDTMSSPLVSIIVTELVLRHLVSHQPQQQQQTTIGVTVGLLMDASYNGLSLEFSPFLGKVLTALWKG
ncbi:MAG: hypothetical protein ACRD5B_14695 [Nitrososphaeraceae archaeon]